MNVDYIMAEYSAGAMTITEVNKALAEIDNDLRLDPNKNVIAPDEIDKYGMLNSGWGSYDKVAIKNLELVYDDMGETPATCYYMGKCYKVEGKKLVDLR